MRHEAYEFASQPVQSFLFRDIAKTADEIAAVNAPADGRSRHREPNRFGVIASQRDFNSVRRRGRERLGERVERLESARTTRNFNSAERIEEFFAADVVRTHAGDPLGCAIPEHDGQAVVEGADPFSRLGHERRVLFGLAFKPLEPARARDCGSAMGGEDPQRRERRVLGSALGEEIRRCDCGTDPVGHERHREDRTDAERCGCFRKAGAACFVGLDIRNSHSVMQIDLWPTIKVGPTEVGGTEVGGTVGAASRIAVLATTIERALDMCEKSPRRALASVRVEASALGVGGDDGGKAGVRRPCDRTRDSFAHAGDVVAACEFEQEAGQIRHQPAFVAGATTGVPNP
jgi:hypothetical protein